MNADRPTLTAALIEGSDCANVAAEYFGYICAITQAIADHAKEPKPSHHHLHKLAKAAAFLAEDAGGLMVAIREKLDDHLEAARPAQNCTR